jgi:hypothetical protein
VLTVRWAASIFATRDWLEPNRLATCVWVMPSRSLHRRSPSARASFVSTNRRSSSVRCRKSPASSTVHPARSNRRRLSARTASPFPKLGQLQKPGQSPTTIVYHALACRLGLFPEHVQNQLGEECCSCIPTVLFGKIISRRKSYLGFHPRQQSFNWSQRSEWSRWSLSVWLFRFYAGNREYNPLAIVIRPWRGPMLFRFWRAFRDSKHGTIEPLRALEASFFQSIAAS